MQLIKKWTIRLSVFALALGIAAVDSIATDLIRQRCKGSRFKARITEKGDDAT